VAVCLDQQDMPLSYEQCWPWIKKALPQGEFFFMFGLAATCWAIWTAQNRACFEKIQIKHPYELIFSASLYMRYWTGLYAMVDQVMIEMVLRR
jgi:hypothetical protein